MQDDSKHTAEQAEAKCAVLTELQNLLAVVRGCKDE
jgi:hypothetical protein